MPQDLNHKDHKHHKAYKETKRSSSWSLWSLWLRLCGSVVFVVFVVPSSLFQIADLRKAADVARFPHRGAEPRRDDRARLIGADERRAEGQHVGAVVLTRVARDRFGRAHRR